MLNQGSDDNEICDYLGIRHVEIGAFQPVRPENQAKNLELMRDADAVLVADIPFGEANIHNLDGLEEVKGELYVHENVVNQDFTGGKVQERLREIKKNKDVKFFGTSGVNEELHK